MKKKKSIVIAARDSINNLILISEQKKENFSKDTIKDLIDLKNKFDELCNEIKLRKIISTIRFILLLLIPFSIGFFKQYIATGLIIYFISYFAFEYILNIKSKYILDMSPILLKEYLNLFKIDELSDTLMEIAGDDINFRKSIEKLRNK